MAKLLTWALHTPVFRGFRSSLGRIAVTAIEAKHGAVTFYLEARRAKILDFVRSVKKETRLLLLDVEAYQLYVLTESLAKIPGDIAEVGVYRGGSAKIIAEAAKNEKQIHLFETFEGLPEVDVSDASRFVPGQYGASEEEVRAYLSAYPTIHIYPGLFPETAGPITDKVFSFVNLDVDLYQGTKDSLVFFYTRLSRGGALVSHDYSTAEGVRLAFDEFFADKPEVVVELAGSQGLVIKL